MNGYRDFSNALKTIKKLFERGVEQEIEDLNLKMIDIEHEHRRAKAALAFRCPICSRCGVYSFLSFCFKEGFTDFHLDPKYQTVTCPTCKGEYKARAFIFPFTDGGLRFEIEGPPVWS